MKDIFAARSASEFQTLLDTFTLSLEETLPEPDAGMAEFIARCRERSNEENMRAWNDSICATLTRQHARYVRAVASITGAPATVYHAIRYRDSRAIEGCGSPMGKASILHCLRVMEEADVDIFWKYMVELSDVCIRWSQRTPPIVPTPEEISKDIASRRSRAGGGGDSPKGATPPPAQLRGLTQGVDDLWTQLCQSRGVDVLIDHAIRERVRECVRANAEFTTAVLESSFPELGSHPFTADECGIFDRMRNLITMDDSIPRDMMNGIETVASRIINDLNNGTCDLASLDLEGIGQQVISRVSDTDMSTFAANIDKIMPALERAHRGFP